MRFTLDDMEYICCLYDILIDCSYCSLCKLNPVFCFALKVWQIPGGEPVPLSPREIPLVPVRVSSVFAGRKEEEIDDGDSSILDKERIVCIP